MIERDDNDERDDGDADRDADEEEDANEAFVGEDVDAAGVRWPKVLPTIFPAPPSWPTVFGRTAPLECEIGFGRPHFIQERSVEVPDHDVVGIEWKGRWPRKVWEKQRKGHYKNVRALHGNAWLLFGALFAPSSLSLIVLNFPDPWWKTKHQKRRVVSDTFAKLMASRLAPGGRILIQTDVASLLEEYLARVEAQPGLRNINGAFRLCPKKPTQASSHREKRCRVENIPIFRALMEKT